MSDDRDRDRSDRGGEKKFVKHSRIKNLGCFEEVHNKVISGHPLPEVARYIQEDMLESTDIGKDSLVTMLSRYRKDVAPQEITNSLLPTVAFEAEKRVLKGIEELEELEDLYKRQMERIEMGMKFETATNILNRHLNSEIALAADILRKRHNIKMDTGVGGGRNLGTLGIRPELQMKVDSYSTDIVEAVKSHESKGRVLSLAKALVKVSKEDLD